MPAGVGPPRRRGGLGWRRSPSRSPPLKIGEIRVMSGRCVPPRYGSLRIQSVAGACSKSSTAATASGIEPRWTGMCSACMTSSPAGSKSAVEQSRRSLMFAECAARTRTAPISSQAECSAPIRTWRVTGSRLIGRAPPRSFRGRQLGSPARGQHEGRLRELENAGPSRGGAGRRARRGGPARRPTRPPNRASLTPSASVPAGAARGEGLGLGTTSASRMWTSSISAPGSR